MTICHSKTKGINEKLKARRHNNYGSRGPRAFLHYVGYG